MADQEKVEAFLGRPLAFKSAEELQKKIDEYFAWAEKNKKPLTLERLACFLDCETRTLRNYEQKDAFFPTIKRARQIIFASKLENLNTRKANTAGIIFDLCNNRKEDYSQKHNEDSNNKSITIIANNPIVKDE